MQVDLVYVTWHQPCSSRVTGVELKAWPRVELRSCVEVSSARCHPHECLRAVQDGRVAMERRAFVCYTAPNVMTHRQILYQAVRCPVFAHPPTEGVRTVEGATQSIRT